MKRKRTFIIGAHLASVGDLGVQPANEGSHAEGQGGLKNWQFGLEEHTSVQNDQSPDIFS